MSDISIKKINKIILTTFYILYLSNTEIQAISGKNIEEVTAPECQQKGIVRLYSPDIKSTSSGVLFYEGEGLFGLCTKHQATFLSKTDSYIDLGGISIKIKKFFTKKDTDLAVFLLETKIDSIENFPKLPEYTDLIPSIIEGDVYGFGPTNSLTHLRTIENSSGTCRKGKIFMSPSNDIIDDSTINLGPKYNNASIDKNHYFISLSIPSKYEFIEKQKIKNAHENGLKLANDERLKKSPSFALPGDSGGPTIYNNKIIALSARIVMKIECPYNTIYSNEPPKEKDNYYPIAMLHKIVRGNKRDVTIYIHNKNGLFGYFDSKNISNDEFFNMCHDIHEDISKEIKSYYTKDESLFLHQALSDVKNEIEFLEKGFQSTITYMTNIQNNVDWIYRAMDASKKSAYK